MNARVPQPDEANVTQQRGASSTEYLITGDLPSVFRAIEKLFAEKHPFGYGTRVHHIEMENDGRYGARVSHSNSRE